MMRLVRTLLTLFLPALLFIGAPGRASAPAPILILVSIDGFRWDYLDLHPAPALAALAARGVRADGLIPAFPSKTFPNHYTQVTGLRPGTHGIVSNTMEAPDIPGRFTLSAREVQADSRWWGGEPIWVTAGRQGLRSGTMFWPGSEYEIAGARPTYWKVFDDKLPIDQRTDQVLEWLRLPDQQRPALFTLYFSDVDTAGHWSGPDSPELVSAIARVDREIGRLVGGVAQAGLAATTNILVVSDHGMAATSADRRIYLDDYVALDTVDVFEWSPLLSLNPRQRSADVLHSALAGKHAALRVYRRDELPPEYHLAGHPRLPALMGVADEGWTITSRAQQRRGGRQMAGDHGYDPALRSMHGVLIGAGPGLREGFRGPTIEAVHLYELMCSLLAITPAKNEGTLVAWAPFRR